MQKRQAWRHYAKNAPAADKYLQVISIAQLLIYSFAQCVVVFELISEFTSP